MLRNDKKPVTFGPGLFKSKGNSRQELLDRLTRAIAINRRNDQDVLLRLQEKEKEDLRKQQRNSTNLGLGLLVGQGLLGDSIKDGSKYIANSLFGGESGKGLLSGFFGGGASAAAPAAQALPIAAQSSGITGLTSIDTAVPALMPETATASAPFMGIGYGPAGLIAAGTYLGGKSAYDMLRGKEDNSVPGKIGRATLGVATGGLSELGKFLGGQDQNKWETEKKRLDKLKEKGIAVPQELIDSMPTSGQSVNDLINKQYAMDYIGRDKSNNWVNNKFAQSRDEKDLRPEDVAGYASFMEKFGNNYINAPLDVKLKVAQEALNKGLVNEHHGTIDLAEDSDFDAYARQLLGL